MEEEKKESSCRRCCVCFSYQCYFTKGYMRFTREKVGYCSYNNKIVGNKETCEKWRSNQSKKYRMDKILVKSLNDTIGELVEVTSIIKDYLENKKLSEDVRDMLTKKLEAIDAEI